MITTPKRTSGAPSSRKCWRSSAPSASIHGVEPGCRRTGNPRLCGLGQGKPIGSLGFKVETFFSWMSGVLPEFRRQGIASAIMRRQHQWCHQHGMRHVSARIHNLNIPMLQLCLKHRYLITGSVMESEERLKVMLQHTLQGGMSHPREAISLDHDEPIGPRAVSAEISESLPLSQLELSDSSLEDELSDPGSD